jgi:hypothetical protein
MESQAPFTDHERRILLTVRNQNFDQDQTALTLKKQATTGAKNGTDKNEQRAVGAPRLCG